ncbi:hypothetical protein EYZ11_002573 [Aspergillus tanneri]|uniref:Uncharacterized protein n=1 Tax=Aspergillus tanneri TaxID=1220188 RepID=A0A4S3JQI2_9EURO|nr:uncharacterized protein ATNIH1004_001450 [Aspergillus tanneri]KAA8652545.1 hypothetical protein ATNIH1004_001450 [Aspergillus tanneri]THC97936.1 hypothetical protein EYZ11_002573 [Aspergillus tanneri]
MMVPRAFLFTSVPSPIPSRKPGKRNQPSKSTRDFVAVQDISGLDLPDKEASEIIQTTRPVFIPPKRGRRGSTVHSDSGNNGPKVPKNSRTVRRPSIASILEATAIPVPRRNWTIRESRKLPRGNHVQDFSRLLMDGVESRESHLLEGAGNTPLDILLSPPEGSDKSVIGSDCDSETPSFSGRSMSLESTPSLDPGMESPDSTLSALLTPSSHRSPSERRYRRWSQCENCAFDHPLLETESPDPGEDGDDEPTTPSSITPRSTAPLSRSFPRLGSTFKSNLTASLRAIKSAAQSVSTFATPSVQPDDFLTRSLFTISPEMTDDRRPPPMEEPPSPALRRYLNPIIASPAEMYPYQDHPHESLDPRNCPVSVQMQTYRRSSKRGSRKSGFPLVCFEGREEQFLPFDPEIPPITRQREPRENSDFLRMVVLEMNMRRSGKLRDDIPTRARVWLPPRKGNQNRFNPYDSYEDVEENSIPSRWVGVSVGGV